MAQLSISEAAKLVARDRKTLYRLIKEGRLSATQDATGTRQVETSELLRVFGEIRQPETLSETPRDSRATVSMRQHETVESEKIELLKAELEQLRIKDQMVELELKHAREVINVREEQIQDLRKALLLLEAPRSQAAPDPAPKGFWTKPRRLFGW